MIQRQDDPSLSAGEPDRSAGRSLSATLLLARWQDGDADSLAQLIERKLPFLEEQVRRRLGPELRRKEETQDFVQDALVELLRYSPSFRVEDERALDGLLVRLLVNLLRDKSDWYRARRRDLARERPLPRDTVLALDRPRDLVRGPATLVAEHEEQARVRLALEFLSEDERRWILERDFDGRSFVDMAKGAGVTADAVRMRYHRALIALTRVTKRMKDGDWASLAELPIVAEPSVCRGVRDISSPDFIERPLPDQDFADPAPRSPDPVEQAQRFEW